MRLSISVWVVGGAIRAFADGAEAESITARLSAAALGVLARDRTANAPVAKNH